LARGLKWFKVSVNFGKGLDARLYGRLFGGAPDFKYKTVGILRHVFYPLSFYVLSRETTKHPSKNYYQLQ
jgi:hypothetical protein